MWYTLWIRWSYGFCLGSPASDRFAEEVYYVTTDTLDACQRIMSYWSPQCSGSRCVGCEGWSAKIVPAGTLPPADKAAWDCC
jgi:hypothetical protein